MKSLERFWHYHRHENPTPTKAAVMLGKNLSPTAKESLNLAMQMIAERALPRHDEDWAELMTPLEELSVALCAGLERMRATVPADMRNMDREMGPRRPDDI